MSESTDPIDVCIGFAAFHRPEYEGPKRAREEYTEIQKRLAAQDARLRFLEARGERQWDMIRKLALLSRNQRRLMREAVENCETCRGSADCARCKTFAAALLEKGGTA